MKAIISSKTIEIPEAVQVKVSRKRVRVSGPLGEIEQDFSHAPVNIRRSVEGLVVDAAWPDKRKTAVVGTIGSHVRNMITGVTKGFTYKLMIVFAHFPMSVKVQGKRVIIENFSGERKARTAKIIGNTKVSVNGGEVIVQGIDIGHVSQTAANIQQATRIKKKDPRIFLDGIYVFEKRKGM